MVSLRFVKRFLINSWKFVLKKYSLNSCNFYSLLPLCDAPHHVAVVDGGPGLLHAGLELAEAVGDGEAEGTAVLGIHIDAPSEDVALRGTRIIAHVLVERGVGHQPHGEPVVAEERALQGESILTP